MVIEAVTAAEQLPTVVTKVYMPLPKVVTLFILGFCWILAKPLGPTHA